MRRDICNSIRQFSPTTTSRVEDPCVVDLGFTAVCAALLTRTMQEKVSRYLISARITNDEIKLTFVGLKSERVDGEAKLLPHQAMTFKRNINKEDFINLPERLKWIIRERGYLNITSTEPINFQVGNRFSRNVNTIADMPLYLIVGYSKLGLYGLTIENGIFEESLIPTNRHHSLSIFGQAQPTSSLLNCGAWWKSIYDADNDYDIPLQTEIKFEDNIGKKLLTKAGRKKPQGDLILFFGKNSCLASGVNGGGEVSMTLQNAAPKHKVAKFDSEVPEGSWAKILFNYPEIYTKFISTAKNYPSAVDISYGLTTTNNPVLIANFGSGLQAFEVKYYLLNKTATIIDDDALSSDSTATTEIVPMSLTDEVMAALAPTEQVVATTVQMQPAEVLSQLTETQQGLLTMWRDVYRERTLARGNYSENSGPLNHFNAFVMDQVEKGIELGQEHIELYNFLKEQQS